MSGDTRRGGGSRAGSTEERQGLLRGCCGFAEMKDGQGDEDRKESGQVGMELGTHLPAVARGPCPGLKLHIALNVVGELGDIPGYVASAGLYVDDLEGVGGHQTNWRWEEKKGERKSLGDTGG